jgi:hypothetical protein
MLPTLAKDSGIPDHADSLLSMLPMLPMSPIHCLTGD